MRTIDFPGHSIGGIEREIRHFHMACGIGSGAAGFNRSTPRAGNMVGRMRCIGGIDVDPGAIRAFDRLTGARGTVMDLFSREQYIAFHGREPPPEWREATPDDIRRAAGGERPHIVFASYPCVGNSGLLSQAKSKTPKYQAVNELALRGTWLTLEAWKDDPPELMIWENVPRVAVRSRHLLDQIIALERSYGYAVAETVHDCGKIGGLAQSRKRYLKVARHMAKVPNFLYEPPSRMLRGVGTVLGRMPLPGDPAAGPMHRVPSLQWKTWCRLAFVEAGSDWRSLNKLVVENGHLRDYLIVPQMHAGVLPRPSNDGFSKYAITPWDRAAGTVLAGSTTGQGAFAVSDPRTGTKYNDCFRVVHIDDHSPAVTAGTGPSAGGLAVADPRSIDRSKGDHYLTGGHYGVVAWDQPSGAVSASACHDNGRWSVADPRLPAATDHLVAVIRALDGTWHRPFTTLELAALQSIVDPEEQLWLDGMSDERWRRWIGNAVPRDAAEAVGDVMGSALLAAWAGETFALSEQPIWVKPFAAALSVPDLQTGSMTWRTWTRAA